MTCPGCSRALPVTFGDGQPRRYYLFPTCYGCGCTFMVGTHGNWGHGWVLGVDGYNHPDFAGDREAWYADLAEERAK